ncbi:hypothetical protein [Gordonia paraffinivorans]|uniref:hypothetical protein n=1 Tax=Gordonia paraffinivorans TaxID=175628 RepID=UPI0011B21AF3|nr:hypothetical protein [Gordonia paraffinivorans]
MITIDFGDLKRRLAATAGGLVDPRRMEGMSELLRMVRRVWNSKQRSGNRLSCRSSGGCGGGSGGEGRCVW